MSKLWSIKFFLASTNNSLGHRTILIIFGNLWKIGTAADAMFLGIALKLFKKAKKVENIFPCNAILHAEHIKKER